MWPAEPNSRLPLPRFLARSGRLYSKVQDEKILNRIGVPRVIIRATGADGVGPGDFSLIWFDFKKFNYSVKPGSRQTYFKLVSGALYPMNVEHRTSQSAINEGAGV